MTDNFNDLTVDEATRKQREQAYLVAAEAATKNVNKAFMKWCADHEGELEVYACEYCGDDIDIMDSWSTQLLLTTIGDNPDPDRTTIYRCTNIGLCRTRSASFPYLTRQT